MTEDEIHMLLIGRNALVTAIMSLSNMYCTSALKDLRDIVNKDIEDQFIKPKEPEYITEITWG